jgi:hypothetical protein
MFKPPLVFALGWFVASSSAPASSPCSVAGWEFTDLSHLLPDQPQYPAMRHDCAPTVSRQGVSWLSNYPVLTGSRAASSLSAAATPPDWDWDYVPLLGSALAFCDRTAAAYLTPNRPYPPEWTWLGVCEPSSDGPQCALPLADIWPPDAGPTDPRYVFTEMFYLNDQGLNRITCDQASLHVLPSLYEGRIAWQSRSAWDPSDDWEIYFWDGATTRRITDNAVHDTHPSLYQNVVAWCSDGNVVYLSIPPAGEPGPLPSPVVVGPGEAPSLFKNKIAYQSSDGDDMEIFLHDIHYGETLQITDNEDEDRNPSLYDGTIAWQSARTEMDNAQILYWDGTATHQLTNDAWYDYGNPSLWGAGLNTTIAYEKSGLSAIPPFSFVMCARRALLSLHTTPNHRETTVAWPSLQERSYRVEYSDDLVNWKIAAESVPSAGYGETSWTDGPDSGTTPPPSEVSQRFYRVCEHGQSR